MQCYLRIIGLCVYKISENLIFFFFFFFFFYDTRDFKRNGQFSTEYHNENEIYGSNISFRHLGWPMMILTELLDSGSLDYFLKVLLSFSMLL